jgi:hypothetical protein
MTMGRIIPITGRFRLVRPVSRAIWIVLLQSGLFMPTSKLSQYGNVQALEAVFRKTQSPATGSVWLALLTAAPTDTNLTMAAVTEYGATGYARQVFGPTSATAAEPSVISNTGILTFGPMTAGTGTAVTHAAVCDAVSGTTANIIGTVALTASRTPAVGDSLQAAASAFTWSSN